MTKLFKNIGKYLKLGCSERMNIFRLILFYFIQFYVNIIKIKILNVIFFMNIFLFLANPYNI
jgi:hypothetical protein